MTGRGDENRAILNRRVERSDDPSKTLRTLWSEDHDPYPVDGIVAALSKANQSAPDDDRVWLGLADVMTRSGRFEEADRWLTRCERASPDDPVVLRWVILGPGR